MIDSDQPYDPFSSARGASHPNPLFDYLTGFTSRKLKDLFRLAEYIGFNSAHIYGTVRKFGEYPITKFVYETENATTRKQHENLFDKDLRLKGFLTLVSFDIWLTGNSLVSVYEPIKRDLQCPHCGTREAIKACKYSFNLDKLEFRHDCRNETCRRSQVFSKVIDEPLRNPKRIKLIRWDPKLIDIDANPITGECVYYLTIPRALIADVRAGNRNKIDHMPMEFLSAMKEKKLFKFEEDAIYHMKMPGPAGVESHWGYPPITAAIKLFMFAAVLRRANEAIALEHITPFRVMHPLSGSGQGDPLTTINLGKWRNELEQNLKMFRRDPLRAMFSPVPLGVINVGGDGRTLLTLGELQEAEKDIVLSLGVPMEFLTGGLGQTRGEITLRMIENQLRTHIENLNGLSQWIEERVTSFLKWDSIPVKLADFKMLDDDASKQVRLQLWSQGQASNTTIAEDAGLDLEHERKQKQQEALLDARAQAETQLKIQKEQSSLSLRVQQQSMQASGGMAYDPMQIMEANKPIAEQLTQLPPSQRKSRLDDLQKSDIIAYLAVKYTLEQLDQSQTADLKAQAQASPG